SMATLRSVVSNSANGKAISSPTHLTRRDIKFNGDGTATVTDAGIDGVFTVPGAGNIAAQAGRGTAIIPAVQAPVISPGPATFLFQAGQSNPVFPAACPYLQ